MSRREASFSDVVGEGGGGGGGGAGGEEQCVFCCENEN